jgi:hypothetical protein
MGPKDGDFCGRRIKSRSMTRAVVVDIDAARAARRAEALRGAGYVVELCGGPQHDPCPVLGNLPCPLADRADVLIYDAWVAGADNGRDLIAEVRETYPDLPVVLTSVEPALEWVEADGPHRVTALTGDPSAAQLLAAVETALTEQGMAV